MQISKYFASLGVDLDRRSFREADKALDGLEKRFKKLGSFGDRALNISLGNFSVDQKKLNFVLGNALDLASSRVGFEVTRFVVDQGSLNRSMIMAMRRASEVASVQVRPTVREGSATKARGVSRGLSGGIYAGVSSLYAPALALGLGGYGLSNLNQRNQQVVSAQLQSQAVVQQAGGTAEQGTQSFDWLRQQGNRIGFNYLDASGDYNKLLSGLTGAGMSVQQGQGVFQGFSELSRVNKLDRNAQTRVYRALSQVAGKNQLMSEELTGQLAESLPGAVSIFAEAYQNQLSANGKGGGKTGQAAITELLAAMKKRQVKGDILTYAGSVASQRAAPGLAAAGTASQAEQARYQNQLNDMAVLASSAGVEEGFARIFRTLNSGLSESGGLVRTLSEGFNEATKWADDLVLWPQSFIRALEGKDSVVADWLGFGKTSQLRQDWDAIKQALSSISAIKFDFLPTLEATTREIAGIMNSIAAFQNWKNGNGTQIESTDTSSPWATFKSIISNTGLNIDRAQARGDAVYGNSNSIYYQDPEGYDSQQRDMAMAQQYDRENGYGYGTNTNQFQISINVDPQTLANMDVQSQAEDLGNWFRNELERVQVNFPQKE